jgi:undecaprenyl-diphosphatase
MSFLDAACLAILQGITEFLPISSSGHLVIGQWLLGWDRVGFLFDILLHVGTLGAICLFYRRDISEILSGTKKLVAAPFSDTAELLERESVRLVLLIGLAMIPTGIFGLALREGIAWFSSEGRGLITPVTVGGLLVVNGCVLFGTRFIETGGAKAEESSGWSLWGITPEIALFLGAAQGIAVLPGFSRAGLTITAALLVGLRRADAARFSFLISIPAILGALVVESASGPDLAIGATEMMIYAGAAVVAAVTGYGAIKLLLGTLKRAWFHHFSWYCWIVGGLTVYVAAF